MKFVRQVVLKQYSKRFSNDLINESELKYLKVPCLSILFMALKFHSRCVSIYIFWNDDPKDTNSNNVISASPNLLSITNGTIAPRHLSATLAIASLFETVLSSNLSICSLLSFKSPSKRPAKVNAKGRVNDKMQLFLKQLYNNNNEDSAD